MRFVIAVLLLSSSPAHAQTCDGLRDEAAQRGFDPALTEQFLATVALDPAVIRADRAQGVFQRDFIDFARRLTLQGQIDNAHANAGRYDSGFNRIESEYGVPRDVLVAF